MNFLKVALVLFSTWVLKTSEGVPYVTVKQGRLFGETLEFNEDNLSTQVDIFKVSDGSMGSINIVKKHKRFQFVWADTTIPFIRLPLW